jgi:CRISPR-associated protein Csb1
MSDIRIDEFDDLLKGQDAAAIVFQRKLKPVEGKDAWVFPPTFAQSESAEDDEEGGGGSYQIDSLPGDPRGNVCLIDSVGSQANRIEPIFKVPPYSALVPQVKIRLKDKDEVNLLDAGHRAADAVVRFSKTYGPRLWDAFRSYRSAGDCSELVRLAPTSLLFGVWDSRGTGAKIQRILRSVIRAYNVVAAKRSATYRAAYDYTANEVIDPERDKGSGKNNPLSQEGFKYSLATGTHGGVLVRGEIQQEAIINLVALRTLTSDRATQRYLLGLALVALSYRDQQGFNLREGCLLCAASEADFDGKWRIVSFNGTEDGDRLRGFTHGTALAFAEEAAKDIRVEQPEPDDFDAETADRWLAMEKKKRKVLAKTKHPAKAVADEAAGRRKEKVPAVAPDESSET